jgi:glycolate oxidase iron-sulfur subunit
MEGKTANAEHKLLACIHCGLCLEACPTYALTGDENDSPRGRIYLMRARAEGRIGADSQALKKHLGRCLGCRACEAACPAGVEYGQLLEHGRAAVREAEPVPGLAGQLLNIALRYVWPHPQRLKLFFAGGRVMRDTGLARLCAKIFGAFSPRLRLAFALLAESQVPSPKSQVPSPKSQVQNEEPTVLLFRGCVTEGLFPHVNRATERVLQANGCAAGAPDGQGCCGALHAHAGDLEGARKLARRNIAAFGSGKESIVTNAGGCGAMLAGYGYLLEHDAEYAEKARRFSARVHDVSQQLAGSGLREVAANNSETITYDASCHLLYGQKAGAEPVAMLRAAGVRLVPLPDSERCCGAAGVYNLLEVELSQKILAEKLGHVAATGATTLATGNPGCHLHLAAGAKIAGQNLRVCHPVELLDEAYAQAGFYGAISS